MSILRFGVGFILAGGGVKMSDGRKIYCMFCGRFVGLIRDAKLMKGLKFVCRDCPKKSKEDESFYRILNEIVGGKK